MQPQIFKYFYSCFDFVFSMKKRTLLVGFYNLTLLKIRFYCSADLPAKELNAIFLIVNIRLKKHPSFKRKAFLPTRRRATLVSVFVFVLKGEVFPKILVTYDNSGEPIQDNIYYALFLLGSVCYNVMISCCLVLPLWHECIYPPQSWFSLPCIIFLWPECFFLWDIQEYLWL